MSTETELEIQPLVAAVNTTGRMSTVRSCHGYWTYAGPVPPYVQFVSDVAIAEELAIAIFHYGPVTEKLHHYWQLTGLVLPGDGLCFRLSAENFWFNRRKLREDIDLLSEIVRALGKESAMA